MSLNRKIILSLFFIGSVISACYLTENITKETGRQTGNIIAVTQDNQPLAYMDTDLLKELGKAENTRGATPTGPSLSYVLAAAGAGNFNNITVKSLPQDDTDYNISPPELDGTFVFSFTDHNTVNLIKTDRSPALLVADVSEIIIQTGK